ncbi:MAG: hypothetical protein F4X02_16525, partial [Chloroflexi bacterium]|nr:hypothetical protein [Chloroflexota bacterium]
GQDIVCDQQFILVIAFLFLPPPPRSFALVSALFLLFSFSLAPVYAATITVNRTSADIADDDECSLAEAIINANDDAQTHDDCAAGSGADEINLSTDVVLPADSPLNITTSLTIKGNRRTLSGPGRLLSIGTSVANADLKVTINGLKVTNNNSAGDSNIALEIWTRAEVTINNSDFHSNGSTLSGAGAIYAHNSPISITINNSRFYDNRSSVGGGAIYYNGFSTNSTFTINNSRFSRNRAAGQGGAVNATSLLTMTVNESTFNNNIASEDGGAILQSTRNTYIFNSTFNDNSAGVSGGAIFNQRYLLLENSTLFNNTSVNHGGALYGRNSTFTDDVTVRHVTFVNNESAGTGNIGNTIFFQTGSTAQLYNSIIVKKPGAQGNEWSGVTTNISNIIYLRTTDTVDPLLGGRAGNPAYYTLQANSPAIDAADGTQCGGSLIHI